MPTLDLTGLQIASPIGHMAALGLMRVCHEDHGLDIKLFWRHGHACIDGIDAEDLRQLLVEHIRGRSAAPEFNFKVDTATDQPKTVMHVREIRPEDYRAAARDMADDARGLGFLAGFATDTIVNDKGFVSRTAFDFSSGRQGLIGTFRNLAERLDVTAMRKRVTQSERIRNALFGGPYEKQNSFGWDPATLMSHGQNASAPTLGDPPGQPWLIWLAVESLPWHPVMPVGRLRPTTTGFDRDRNDRDRYIWPQWNASLTAPEVRLLRCRPVGTLETVPGVEATWQSCRTSAGKYGFFTPAARIPSDSLNRGRFAR